MTLLDFGIVIIPLMFVLYMAFYCKRYVRGVADFVAAGRVCGRYVISVADITGALSIMSVVGYCEATYKTGFAMGLWNNVLLPLGMVLSLTGFILYRYRETRVLSSGQFLEMRYSRSFRIFASIVRCVGEMLTNMIVPAISARFFIYLFGLPHKVNVFGFELPTFAFVVLFVLFLALIVIFAGGQLALIITDTIQGFFCYPILAVFAIYLLCKLSWFDQIAPVMMDRVPGESFFNPYDINALRDFNLFALLVTAFSTILNRGSWMGGMNSAGFSAHEQKMAGILGTWRNGFSIVFFFLIGIFLVVTLNHRDFAGKATDIRTNIINAVSGEVIAETEVRKKIETAVQSVPPQYHRIGIDGPLSQTKNLDTPYLSKIQTTLSENKIGNEKFQEFRTLYHQMMLPVTLKKILPAGLLGLFALLMVLFMLSSDDGRIFASATVIVQDIILPLHGKPLSPKTHLWLLRGLSLLVMIFFFCGAFFMSQLDYINLFCTIMSSIWLGGAGAVMIGGLYTRFGNTTGAYSAIVVGAGTSIGGLVMQRNWAGTIYPWLFEQGLVEPVGTFLGTISSPFHPYIMWTMDAVKFPINSVEIFFFAMIFSVLAYILGSLITYKEAYNLDRLLHRGIYNLDGEKKQQNIWTWRNLLDNIISITSDYTTGDKIIAWSVVGYTIFYQFFGTFLLVVVWNMISPWPLNWWGWYFLIVGLIIPTVIAIVTTFWFVIGGIIDLRKMFRKLADRVDNTLDDGFVEGSVSIADKDNFEQLEKKEKSE